MKLCCIVGCGKKHYGKGLCSKHYYKQYFQDNKEQITEQHKQYNKDNKEHISKCRKQQRENNKENIAKRMKQYYLDNKEHIAKRIKQWQKDNPEYRKQWYQDNKEHFAEWQRKYLKTPAGKASKKACWHNRRLLTKDLTIATVQRVYEANIKKYGVLTCYLCGEPIVFGDKKLKDSLDHSTPVTREGTNKYDNLGIAHQHCNNKKHTKTLKEWIDVREKAKSEIALWEMFIEDINKLNK